MKVSQLAEKMCVDDATKQQLRRGQQASSLISGGLTGACFLLGGLENSGNLLGVTRNAHFS